MGVQNVSYTCSPIDDSIAKLAQMIIEFHGIQRQQFHSDSSNRCCLVREKIARKLKTYSNVSFSEQYVFEGKTFHEYEDSS